MTQPLFFPHTSSSLHQYHYSSSSLTLFPRCSCLPSKIVSSFWACGKLQTFSGRKRYYPYQFRVICLQVRDSTEEHHDQVSNKMFDRGESKICLHVQTLRDFPVGKLYGEVVLVRFDSTLLLEEVEVNSPSVNRALSTIKYLHNARAKVRLVSSWGRSSNSTAISIGSLADHLSSLLQIKVVPACDVYDFMLINTKTLKKTDVLLLENLTKFREEPANCSEFSEKLSSDVFLFVNDAFSVSHKVLASNVGVARFCYASVAGFLFEEELHQLTDIRKITSKPYMVIIGGSNFLQKAKALHLLASICDGLIFVGMLAFQVMHILGKSVPFCFLENGVSGEVLKLIQLAHKRNIPLYFPNDLRCVNSCNTEITSIFPSDGILTGWTPCGLGPMSLVDISSLIGKCKKVLWIGPVKFGTCTQDTRGETELALMLEAIHKNGCDITIVGNAACKAVAGTSNFQLYKIFRNASVVWEFLKGRTLPGVAALDGAFPLDLDWKAIFSDPTLPLRVDIGSGNGLFLFELARRLKDSNFLGLEINAKLVNRCLDIVYESDLKNRYFISSNATTTFRSIVSTYPGDLIFVSIQCPNPDFNREDNRRRMVQRPLVEAIIDILATNGKVFLQSDIEAVAVRMKEQFVMYGKGRIVVDGGEDGWMAENPFGVRSDWEQHVVDRGAPMYRLMLRKVR